MDSPASRRAWKSCWPTWTFGWIAGRRTREDEGDRPVVYLGEPIHSGYVLIRRDHLANVTSLEHERWKRAHPEFCRKMGIRPH